MPRRILESVSNRQNLGVRPSDDLYCLILHTSEEATNEYRLDVFGSCNSNIENTEAE